jgi:hypothetical protein
MVIGIADAIPRPSDEIRAAKQNRYKALILKEADAGMPVVELCRKHGFSDTSYYEWKAKFGVAGGSDA